MAKLASVEAAQEAAAGENGGTSDRGDIVEALGGLLCVVDKVDGLAEGLDGGALDDQHACSYGWWFAVAGPGRAGPLRCDVVVGADRPLRLGYLE